MKDLKLRIKKKTITPVNHPVYTRNSCWKTIAILDYNECSSLFKYFNKISGIENDAQFAYLIYKHFGEGIYYCQAHAHGIEGFWNFIQIEVTENGFRRLPKKETQEQKENRELYAEQSRIKKQLKEVSSEESKSELQDELNDLQESSGLNKEIIKLDKGRGCAPILKTIIPIYKFHGYQEINEVSSQETKPEIDLRVF